MDIEAFINENTLAFGMICAAAGGIIIAILYVVVYKCFFAKEGPPNPELAPDSTWINVGEFQPTFGVEEDPGPGDRRSKRQSKRKKQQTDAQPSGSSQKAAAVTKLLTDSTTPTAEFRIILGMYYSKYAPSMTIEDIDLVVDNYGGSTAARRELSQQLLNEYGRDLDEFYAAVENGTENIPRKNIPRQKDVEPSIQFVGNNVNSEDLAAMTLQTDLAAALESRNLGRYYEVLKANGINTIRDMGGMTEEIVSMLFPGDDREKIMAMVTAAKLLTDEHDDL